MKKWEKPQIKFLLMKDIDIIRMSEPDIRDEFDNEGQDQAWN